MAHSDSERFELCNEKWKQFDEHVHESVSVRDRLRTVEIQLNLLEKAVMKNAIIGGIIGALIGSGASPAVIQVVDFFLKGR
jgi:hypothetical protein